MMGRFFLWGASGYLLGNLLVGFERADIFSLLLLGVASALAGAFLVSRKFGLLTFVVIVFCGLGFESVSKEKVYWQNLPAVIAEPFEGKIVKREASKAFYQPITLKIIGESEVSTNVLWRAPRTGEFAPGQHIRLDCLLKRPENFDPTFDYRQYLATKNIGYICDDAKAFEVLSREDRWYTGWFHLQLSLRECIHRFLPDPAAGLLEGLFLGGDDGLPKEVSENFRRAGLSHIVAVSGYNMTLVAFAVLLLALVSGLWRKTATLFAIFGILGFLLLIDTSAASIRAACMAWIVFFAFFVGRPANAGNGLLLAGVLMTFTNPLLVRYDVGFQLSFLATLSLIVAAPFFERLLRREGWWWKVIILFLSTVVIELFIFPVLAFHFGTLSLAAPFANLLALPLIPLTMLLGFLMLLFGALIPLLGTLLAFPTWLLLMLLIHIGEIFGGFSWSTIEGLIPTVHYIILWYIVLALLVWYSRKSQYRYALRIDH